MTSWTALMTDRLAKVQPRQTFIIKLWYINPVGVEPPIRILGPFTKHECERIEATLIRPFKREQITTEVPKWATAESDSTV